MGTYTDVFQRIEKKYRITTAQRNRLFSGAGERFEPDAFGDTVIYSLYYDTPENALISRSLESPLYKEKFRIRAYGEATSVSPVFCEIKKKFKGVVYKRRLCCSYTAAIAYMNGACYEDAVRAFPLEDAKLQERATSRKSLQIAREIDYLRTRNPGLAPAMLISCRRRSYISTDGSGIRLTFDSDIRYRTPADGTLALRPNARDRRLIAQDEIIMEVKCAGALPLWFVDSLDRHHIYPQKFSKYGTAFTADRRFASLPDIGVTYPETSVLEGALYA